MPSLLKRTKVELELLSDIDILLMVENRIRGGFCQATHRYTKASNKHLKNYDKNTEPSLLDASNLYGGVMSQK